jgi:hypothetical protein
MNDQSPFAALECLKEEATELEQFQSWLKSAPAGATYKYAEALFLPNSTARRFCTFCPFE